MVVRVQTQGQSELRIVAKALKDFGEKDLRREFYRALQLAKDPMLAAAKDNARAMLPHSGGAGEHVAAGLKARTSSTTAGANPRVRVVFSGHSPLSDKFTKARRKDVAKSRRKHKESLWTPEERTAHAEKRRASAAKAAATRRAKGGGITSASRSAAARKGHETRAVKAAKAKGRI